MDLTRIAAYIVLVGMACMVTAAFLTNWLFGLFVLGVCLAVAAWPALGES